MERLKKKKKYPRISSATVKGVKKLYKYLEILEKYYIKQIECICILVGTVKSTKAYYEQTMKDLELFAILGHLGLI